MTVRRKLGLLAVATTASILVVLGVGVVTSRTLVRSNREIFEGAARGVALVTEVRGLLADIRLQESLSASFGALGREEGLAAAADAVGRLKGDLAASLARLPAGDAKAALERHVADYLALADVTVSKGREYAIDEAMENMTSRSRVPFESAEAAIAGMVRRMDEDAAGIKARAERSARLATVASILMLAVSAGLGVTLVLLRRAIVAPLGEMVGFVGRVAEGDLTGAVRVESRDELGVMGGALARMAGNIRHLLGRAKATSESVADGSRRLGVQSEQLARGAEKQSRAVDEISVFAARMKEQGASVTGRMEELARTSEETSSSILEMTASIEQVARNVEELSSSVAGTSASIEQILASNRAVAQSTDSLNGLIGGTTSAITEIDASIKEVQGLAEDARRLSEEAKVNAARDGGAAVQQTIGEMNRIRRAVLDLAETVGRLAGSVENIGEILVVIDDVAEQTNLLALNAAIIAAQAGEHGRGFAVVATEIRELAERTTSSTKEIAKVIRGIQQETETVGTLVQEGVDRVDAGVGAVDGADAALRKIIGSTERASAASARIAEATAEQAIGSRGVARSIQEVSDRSREISGASAEQARGSESVMRAVEKMREMAEQVRRATVEQTAGASLIAKASASASGLAREVTGESREAQELAERAVREVATIQAAAREVHEVSARMRDVVESFRTLAEQLGEDLSRFRT